MKIAVITPLPPEKTGVAEFSKRLYLGEKEFDVFATSGNDRIGLEKFFYYATTVNYSALIFTLANSDHHLPTIQLLQKFRGFPGVKMKLILHIHDPVLTNLAQKYYCKSNSNFIDWYTNIDNNPLPPDDIYSAFEEFGYSGLSALINGINIDTIISHSDAAIDIIKKDIKYLDRKINKYLKLFHPCFESPNYEIERKRKYDVGIFGVVDNGGKMTHRSIHAIREAHMAGLITSVVVCGYNAKEYAKTNGLEKYGYMTFIENPTHDEMFAVMKETNIAIQGRLLNTGESSGIIPMLIAAGTKSLVSNVGAFSEYPLELVEKADNNHFELQAVSFIARKIRSELSAVDQSHFISQNNKKFFIEKLFEHINKY